MKTGLLKNICCMAAFLVGAGCSPYRYDTIFPFYESIKKRSVRVGSANCFECAMTPEEFESVKKNSAGYFDRWIPFSGEILYCGKLQIGRGYYGLTANPVQYAMGKGDGAWVPVVVYYPDAKKMLYFICDGKI